MKVLQFKDQFINALKEEYPPQEINSFFNLLATSYLGLTRLEIALDPACVIEDEVLIKFKEAQQRLVCHEPIQYILGETEFFGLQFKVNENVLIPRPETEELVQWILDDLNEKKEAQFEILEIGTGTGCIPISLAHHLKNSKISAVDVSEKALAIATDNAKCNNVHISFNLKDILATDFLDEKLDVIVSNPPYVRELEKKEMHRNVLENEPHLALYVSDEDPLIFYRKIGMLAKSGLRKSGSLYFEINQYLAKETSTMLQELGFNTEVRKDIFGNDRMLKANLK
ncbi:peptide chain release factor N(5)-glutamine methyltransferase [Gillisia sp. Hel_I_29]|uniref:peptide chain release factor N(5)-glutamine methyltransferase n=1 Tax=Gillisia sp. Hel_I_29 TaxID=1249975 RepID=UPI0005534C25|nr:peptide chain release factor N(5)-glutamine methyltransferase [Gillisia sp. Hel_I_29]